MRPSFRNLFSFFTPKSKKPKPSIKRAKHSRLSIEVLEDRMVMSATASGAISGIAFLDMNHNGLHSPNELLLRGVPLTLTGTTTFNNGHDSTHVNVTVVTDTNGAYNFENVLPGTYTLQAGSDPALIFQSSSMVTSTGAKATSSLAVTGGQSIIENAAFQGFVNPHNLSLIQYLNTSNSSNLALGTAGSGQQVANFRANNAPTVSATIASFGVPENNPNTTIDLAGKFTDPDYTNSQVTFNITNGTQKETLVINLFDKTAPQTVANFLDYVKAGTYNNDFFHRLAAGFVLQGGAATVTASGAGSNINITPTLPKIANEFGASNTANTIAMAQSGGNINSADDQFFFNLVNNASSLDSQKFTVFGQLADASSVATLAKLATTPVKDESSSPAGTDPANGSLLLNTVPLPGYTGTANDPHFPSNAKVSNLMVINSVTINKQDEFLTYSVTNNSNTGLVTTSFNNEDLVLHYVPGKTGAATITVKATDRFGASVTQTFTVTVNPAPVINTVTVTPDSTTNATKLTANVTDTKLNNSPITLHFQWFQDGATLTGQTAATLTLSSITVKKGDKFTVAVTPTDANSITGAVFTSDPLTVTAINPIHF